MPSERTLLPAECIVDWGAEFLTYTASNGRQYRIDNELGGPNGGGGRLRQVSLSTGTERGVIRIPAPPPSGVSLVVSYILPGATWKHDAGSRYEPFPEGIFAALEALGQARKRAEAPDLEGLLWPEE